MRKVCIFMILNCLQSCQISDELSPPLQKLQGFAQMMRPQRRLFGIHSVFFLFPSFPETVNLFHYLSNQSNKTLTVQS